MKVAVSYLKSEDKNKCVKEIDKSICDYIHVDLCDGKYVDTKNFTVSEVIKLLSKTNKKLDVHLMCNEPKSLIEKISLLNIDTITVHPRACKNVIDTIYTIQNYGIKAGIAIDPDENVNAFEDLYNIVDRVLLMSVYPGKGGQSFIEETVNKVDELNSYKEKYNFETSIDGGINDETITLLKDKDIDVIVSGSFVTLSDDYNRQIEILKK